jgi:hypothetical protein
MVLAKHRRDAGDPARPTLSQLHGDTASGFMAKVAAGVSVYLPSRSIGTMPGADPLLRTFVFTPLSEIARPRKRTFRTLGRTEGGTFG